MRIDLLDAGQAPSAETGLADVLVDCVDGGASVGFLASLGQEEARAWWRKALQDPDSLTWVARDDHGRIIGTVRLGRTVLLLDTQTGSPAERLYERMGWQRVGVVDDYAATPDGRLEPTTFMAKRLTVQR